MSALERGISSSNSAGEMGARGPCALRFALFFPRASLNATIVRS